MNETVKLALKICATLVVVGLIVLTVVTVERRRQAGRKVTQEAITKVKIEGAGEWYVNTYNAKNGKCYDIHIRGNWAFATPCE